ncbi:MAG: histidine kinase [Burkholderiales bacterium]|nr:histidine kinase [Burkholderiales bacterium]
MSLTSNSLAPDQPLPSAVNVHSETWLTRYRHYPVFSRTWYRARCQAWSITQSVAYAVASALCWLADRDFLAYFVFSLPGMLGYLALVFAGPGMAVWIRQRGYAARKEAALLATVLCLGAVLSVGLFEGLRSSAAYLAYGDAGIRLTVNDIRSRAAPYRPVPRAVAQDAGTGERSPNGSGEFLLALRIINSLSLGAILIYSGSGFDLWVFFRQRKKLNETQRQQESQRATEARREAELRLSVLAAQVEPHFLFNTLAGVRSAILSEPQRATAIVDHLVAYLRATIPQMRDDGGSAQARLAQQLDAARAYLGLMQARIPRLSFEVVSEVEDAALPPLMLISLVENAVKHGVEPKVGAVHIAVSARRSAADGAPMLELTVADNGVGFGGTTSGSGIGLANIRARLEAMYGQRAGLSLKARAGGGVAASIVLPLSDSKEFA